MGMLVKYIFLIVVCVLLYADYVSACKCKVISDEKKFCDSTWGGLVKVRNVKFVRGDPFNERVYRVRFITVSSGRHYIKRGGKNKEIFTSGSSASCGVNLEIGSVYFLSGYVGGNGTLSINNCGSVAKLVDTFSPDECEAD